MGRRHLDELARLGEAHRVAALRYRARPIPSRTVERIVEPYDVAQGREDALVRCYQLWPEEGWRSFMAHRIDSVRDTGETFVPRRVVAMTGAEGFEAFGAEPWARDPWTEPMLHYRDLVSEAIGGGVVGRDHLGAMRDFAARAGLAPEQVRFVHASVFQRTLAGVLRDGTVGPAQLAQIRTVQRVLAGLGWGVGSAAPPTRAAAGRGAAGSRSRARAPADAAALTGSVPPAPPAETPPRSPP